MLSSVRDTSKASDRGFSIKSLPSDNKPHAATTFPTLIANPPAHYETQIPGRAFKRAELYKSARAEMTELRQNFPQMYVNTVYLFLQCEHTVPVHRPDFTKW